MRNYLEILEAFKEIKDIKDLIDEVKKLRQHYYSHQYEKNAGTVAVFNAKVL